MSPIVSNCWSSPLIERETIILSYNRASNVYRILVISKIWGYKSLMSWIWFINKYYLDWEIFILIFRFIFSLFFNNTFAAHNDHIYHKVMFYVQNTSKFIFHPLPSPFLPFLGSLWFTKVLFPSFLCYPVSFPCHPLLLSPVALPIWERSHCFVLSFILLLYTRYVPAGFCYT